jgi:hypothetical protein
VSEETVATDGNKVFQGSVYREHAVPQPNLLAGGRLCSLDTCVCFGLIAATDVGMGVVYLCSTGTCGVSFT